MALELEDRALPLVGELGDLDLALYTKLELW